MADDDFIGLPPGMLDSGTYRAPVRAERPRTEKPDIVFVPTVPGMPAPALPVTGDVPSAESPTERGDAFEVPGAATDDAELGAESESSVSWVLTLTDGSTARVTGTMLLGRDPAHLVHWSGAELLSLVDTTRSVSKTHAALELDSSGLWVHDLDSTNGVWVVVGEDATEVAPGRRVAVPAGAVIELGEYELRVARA